MMAAVAMAGPAPIVRQMVLCERISYDLANGHHLLHNPRVDFALEPGESFPVAYPTLGLFMQVTGSYGTQKYRVRLVDVTDPTVAPVTVFETPERVVDLGKPLGSFRLRSKSWAIWLRNVLFPAPGRYELWLMFDGLPRARAELLTEVGP
jgi:hypothetical protein